MAGLRENASYLHLPRRLRICRVDNAKWRCAPFDQSKRCADILRTRHFGRDAIPNAQIAQRRSEEHTSELQSLMRISYAVFCLKKKTTNTISTRRNDTNH